MKTNVKVFDNENLIFEGKILEIPFKLVNVINKSVELFGDDDPCIIHKSFVYKKFAEILLKNKQQNTLILSEHPEIDFLDFDDYTNIIIKFEGDK